MLAIGSDSHTCSAGAVSCLAIGLGAADVMMALATGETWFKVPESVNVRLVGQPEWYIRGKDTILYILRELKRNTVAAERIVEFSGPGAQYLSCDARFAICNMCTVSTKQATLRRPFSDQELSNTGTWRYHRCLCARSGDIQLHQRSSTQRQQDVLILLSSRRRSTVCDYS